MAIAQCQAQLGWRLVAVNGFPQSVADICGQVVGLRHYTDQAGSRRTYCAQSGHEAQLRRHYPAATYTDAQTGQPVPVMDFGPSPLTPDQSAALAADAERWGPVPQKGI